MARKTKKKAAVNAVADKKIKDLEKLRDFLHTEEKEYEQFLNSKNTTVCDSIKKMYMDSLATIPEKFRNMTVSEIIAYQQKEAAEKKDIEPFKVLLPDIERNKQLSEKKRTQRISRLERKRSLSASVCSSTSYSSRPPALSRVLSEVNLSTPLANRLAAPSFTVTPKFNPRSKLNKALLRKPRAGEILMSVKGSPLHNIMDDLMEKPGVAISLGCGKVLNIAAEKEIEKLQHEIDENTKETLHRVKRQLEEILNN